jgi:hypothetical protein
MATLGEWRLAGRLRFGLAGFGFPVQGSRFFGVLGFFSVSYRANFAFAKQVTLVQNSAVAGNG